MKPIVCYVTDSKSLGLPPSVDAAAMLVEKIRMALGAGADWIQIREKGFPGGRLLALAGEAVASARQMVQKSGGGEARVYVNDRLDVALAAGLAAGAGVAGVHLGGESIPVADVAGWRRSGRVLTEFRVGVSCHSMDSAREAERQGANYIFFGPVFDTPSKRKFGPPQGVERLREASEAIRIPVIAIGGVNETNAEACIRAGAAGIAAIRLFQEAANAEKLKKFISVLHELDKTIR
jgi:thiamine-phosphate pyrophosphorylase